MAIPLRRTRATFISLEPTNTNLAPAPAQATSSAAPSVPATRPPIPLRRTHATFIPLEPASTNTSLPPPPTQPTSSTAPSVPTTRPPVPLRRTPATLIPLEPAPINTSLPPPPSRTTSSTAPSVAPTPLRRTHATLISLAPPESTSASLLPPTQATSSTTPIVPAAVPTLTPSASTSTPVAELPFPLPLPDVLYACNYACGPKLCDWCAKDRPPIGHKDPIPHFIVSTIIRQAMPHRFESPEQIKERELATGLADPPQNLGERDGDDVEYQPGGDFKPPAWDSDKARPKKSSIRKRESTRFAPYPDPSTRNALVRRSTEDIKASLDEALANRMQLNYEGSVAIAIRNEISAIYIPDEAPFKWEPEYTGPPSEAFPDDDTLTSETTANAEPSAAALASSIEEDFEDEAAVVEIVLPTRSKKRRYAEDDDDSIALDTTGMATEGSPTKKARTTRKLPSSKIPAFSIPSFKFPSFSLTIRIPSSFSTAWSSPSPIRSASPSTTSTAVSIDSSSDGSDLDSSSPRKARIAKKKLRFVFSDPSSTHPKFGTRDSIYWHHRRLTSTSKNVRNQKKHKEYVPRDETWSPDEVEHASMGKADWDLMRQASLVMKTSRKNLEERVKKSEAIDASAERFQKLVDRYEAGWRAIDLAGVRARYIRPRKNEVRRERNKEAMPLLGPVDKMRKHYPAGEHPAWDGVDRTAIAEWKRSPHYELRVHQLLEDEEKGKKRANTEPDEATEIATVEDEDEERMRREYLAAGVDEVEAPRGGDSGSAWGAPASGEGEGGLHRQMALSAVDFDSQWSAPSAHHPTDADAGWSTPGAGPSTWASGF